MIGLLAPTLAILLAGLTVIFIGGILVMVVRDLNDGYGKPRLTPSGEGEIKRGELTTWDRS
jgi:hypothetical protein